MPSSSENNLTEYLKDDSAARYILAKLARCGYFVLFKLHQFKILTSLVSAIKFSSEKSPLFLLQFIYQRKPVGLPPL